MSSHAQYQCLHDWYFLEYRMISLGGCCGCGGEKVSDVHPQSVTTYESALFRKELSAAASQINKDIFILTCVPMVFSPFGPKFGVIVFQL